MGRETLVTDKIVSKAGGGTTLGTGPGSLITPTGSMVMGAAQGIAISDGGISGSGLAIFDVAGVDARINLTGRGTQLNCWGVPRLRRINFTYSTFAVAAATAFIDYPIDDFVTLAPDEPWAVEYVFVRKIQDFTGGSVTVVEITAGDAASAVGYIAAGQLDLVSGAPALVGLTAADQGGYLTTPGTVKVQSDQTTQFFRVTLNSTGGDLDTLTAGEASVYVRFWTVPTD